METDGTGSVSARGEASDTIATAAPRIIVTEHGRYRVLGDVAIYDTEGTLLRRTGMWCLCRCGGSRHNPFGDGTHGLKGFDGAESADHGSIADRRDTYHADGITVFDDRTRCAHFGQCTDKLSAVFRADAEPFVDPHGAHRPRSSPSSPVVRRAPWLTPSARTRARWRPPPTRRSHRSWMGPTGCVA